MDAENAPVRRPRHELNSTDFPIAQKPTIETREDMVDEVIVASPEVLQREYAEALKFAEEPVTIIVQRSGEKNAPPVVDCWCNGKGAELLHNGKWIETRAIPVGVPVTTKRKYVEILLRSKVDTVNTLSGKVDEKSERNVIERYTSAKAPLSVIRDNSPMGAQWLANLMHLNG